MWCEKKLNKLMGSHGLSCNDVPEKLHSFVFCIEKTSSTRRSPKKHPPTTVSALKRACAALRWAERHLQDSAFLEQVAIPGPVRRDNLEMSLLSYHYRHKEDSADEVRAEDYLYYQRMVQKAFQSQAPLIAAFVGTSKFATDTSCLPYMCRAKQFIRASANYDELWEDTLERRGQLAHELEALGLDLSMVERCWPVRSRLIRFENFPLHPDFTPQETAARLLKFMKTHSSCERRTRLLTQELESWGLSLDRDDFLTAQFIHGDCDIDAGEVAAVQLIGNALKELGTVIYEANRHHMETLVRCGYLLEHLTWPCAAADVRVQIQVI